MGIFDIFKSKGDTKKTLSNKKAKANQYYAKGMELVDLANNSKNEDEENKYEQRAYNYFCAAVDAGYPDPIPELAYIIKYTPGVPEDKEMVASVLQDAVKTDRDYRVYCELADCYDEGYGVEADFEKAFHWYDVANDKGSIEATFMLAKYYWYGMGCSKDREKAACLLKEAIYYSDKVASDDERQVFVKIVDKYINENPDVAEAVDRYMAEIDEDYVSDEEEDWEIPYSRQ